MALRYTYARWTAADLKTLEQKGPEHSAAELRIFLGERFSETAIRTRLSVLGIRKTARRRSRAAKESWRHWRCAKCGSSELVEAGPSVREEKSKKRGGTAA